MAAYILIAIAAGALSVASLLALSFGLFEGMLFLYLAPLPLFLTGLALGAQAAVIAGGIGTVIASLITINLGISYFFVFALPTAVLCRQGLLWRADASGQQMWYPLGRLATDLATLMAAYTLLAFALAALFADGLVALMESMLEQVATAFAPEAQAAAIVAQAEFMPVAVCTSVMLMLVLNGALAQGLLQRFKRNIRPTADIAELKLPAGMLMAMLVATGLAFVPGTLGVVGKTLAAIGAVTYFLAGLGVIHAWVRNWSARGIVLPLTYVAVILIFWLTLVVIGLGLWSQFRGLRDSGADREEE